MIKAESPLVSIGLPVFNGEATLKNAIESVIYQTYKNIELIISDNCSSDKTEAICKHFASIDKRIKYVRQKNNIGATKNFKFVLDAATGKYYMWIAADDIRSFDFVETNVKFLIANDGYVASTSPNCFEGQEKDTEKHLRFSLNGCLESRYLTFINYCWKSHGIFYSLMKRDVIVMCPFLERSFTALDWAVDWYLVSRGKINRVNDGLCILGNNGVSSRSGAWGAFRKKRIELIFPLYEFSVVSMGFVRKLKFFAMLRVMFALAKLNIQASFSQLVAESYIFYCRYFRRILRKNEIDKVV